MNKNKSKNKKRIYRKVKKSKGGSSNSPFNKLGNSLVQQILNKTSTGTPSLFNHSHKINRYSNRNAILIKDRDDKDLPILIELRKFIFSLEHRVELFENDTFNQLYNQLSDDAKKRIFDYYNTRGETPIFTYYQYIEYIKQFLTEYNTKKQNLINLFGNNNELVSDLEKNKFLNAKKVPISPHIGHIGHMNQIAKEVRHLNIEIEYYESTGQLELPSNFEPIYDLPLIDLKNHPIIIFVDGWLDNIFLNKFRWASDLPINTNELVSYNDILNNFLPWCRSR